MNANEIFEKLNWPKATPKKTQTGRTAPQKGIVSELIEAERERKKRKIDNLE